MSKISVDIDQFSDLIPFFIGFFLQNPDFQSDDSEEFYGRIQKKIKSDLMQHIRNNPNARRQFKLLKGVFDGNGNNAVIQIKPDKKANEHQQITQYLTDSYKPIKDVIREYLI